MWNSVLRSVEAVVFLDRASLTVLCAEEKQPMCIFTAIEFAQLEELYNILLPFVEATDITHGNKVTTAVSFPFLRNTDPDLGCAYT